MPMHSIEEVCLPSKSVGCGMMVDGSELGAEALVLVLRRLFIGQGVDTMSSRWWVVLEVW